MTLEDIADVLALDNLVLCSCCRICYNMCVQKPPYEYSGMLYDKYKEVFVTYITTKVGPP